MKQLFHIESGKGRDETGEALLLQVGEKHCAMAITDADGKKVHKLLYCSLDPLLADSLETFLAVYPEAATRFSKVALSYDFPAALSAPPFTEWDNKNKMLLELFHDSNEDELDFSEPVTVKQVQNIYNVPAKTHELAGKKFDNGKYWHQYSVSVSAMGEPGSGGTMFVDFRPDEFMVLASGQNKVLLTQTFPYSTPEDVIYYLLKICQYNNFSQQTVQLRLSGLIDKDSALYKELYQYFLQISFREAGWEMPPGDYPSHFFTSLNDLARCAL